MSTHNGAILVTGANGLIGTPLVDRLLKQGHEVLLLDKSFHVGHPGQKDFTDKQQLSTLIQKCRGIVHLAAVSRVVWGEQDSQSCWETNVNGLQSLLELAHQAPLSPWVIFASSREVYGQQTLFPVSETATLMPLNIYARSKIEGERRIHAFSQKGLLTATLRFSSVYGSVKDHPDRVVPAFCKNAILGKSLRIDGLLNQLDFTHVSDVINGIIAVIAKLDNKIHDLPPMHFTTGKGTTLLELVKLIESIIKKPVHFYEAPGRTYDVSRFYGSPLLAKKILSWEPTVDLETGITQLINDYQSILNATEAML